MREYALPDNVAALIAHRLEELSPKCLDLLDTAACVGSEFDVHTLASVHEMSPSAAAVGLAAAVRNGVIVPLDTHYKEFESLAGWDIPEGALRQLGTARYPEALQERIMANHDLYSDGLAAWRAGQWAQAQKRFELCVDACELDMVARNFARRCRDRGLRGEVWDGIERPAKS